MQFLLKSFFNVEEYCHFNLNSCRCLLKVQVIQYRLRHEEFHSVTDEVDGVVAVADCCFPG